MFPSLELKLQRFEELERRLQEPEVLSNNSLLVEIQKEYGVAYHRYWFNEDTGEVFCLVEAPDKDAAEAVHREAHGLLADEITEVQEGQP